MNSSFKRRTRKRHPQLSARDSSPSPVSSLKEEKVISHFLIRYLERKEVFEEKEKDKEQ